VGANAVIGARYDATEIMSGVTEVLAYGTAVVVEPHAGIRARRARIMLKSPRACHRAEAAI
jgi:hypothetical protein